MKFGESFDYGGFNSWYDFGLIIVSTGDDTSNLALNRELIKGSTTKFRTSANHIGAEYSDTLSFDIALVKDTNINTSQKDMVISREELRKITAWLTSTELPTLLHFIDYDDIEERIDYFGVFTNVEPYALDNNLFGIRATFMCSSPYGFTKEMEYNCEPNSQITIDNTSDEWNKPVYPRLTITPNATTTIEIFNDTDDSKCVSLNVNNGNVLYIDCQNTIVTDKAGIVKFADLGWLVNDLDSLYWFRLLHGQNIVRVSGNANLNIKCRYPRKVGEY